jgi:hypothetical protein
MFKPIACLFLLCFSTAAFATADASRTRVAIDKGDFDSQRARIEAALADGKTYAEISPDDRATVRVALERMGNQLDDVSSVNELPESKRLDLFNEQEKVNTILTRAAADSRLICTRVQKTGNLRRTVSCETVAERRQRTEASQEALRQTKYMPQLKE